MRPPDDPEVRAWLEKVAEDFRVAEVLADLAEPLDDAICFHCQQAAEKLLKALLVSNDIRPPRTHDLEELVALLGPPPPLPADVDEALSYLTEFAVIPRYPVRADLRSPGRVDRARRDLDRLITWVRTTYDWQTPRRPKRKAAEEG